MYHYNNMKFADLILYFNTPADLKQLLDLLLTDREKELIEKRIDVIKKLLQEMPHRQIAEEGNHSISQVTAGSKAIRKIKTETKSRLKKILCSTKTKPKDRS